MTEAAPLPFDDMLADATIAEVTVPVCMAGKLRREYEDLTKAKAKDAELARGAGDERLASRGPKVNTGRDERIAELLVLMRRHTYPFILRALPSREWNKLCAKYPARPDAKADQASQVNAQTFFPALVRASVVDPVMSEEQWDKLLGVLTDAQFDSIGLAAWQLNRRDEEIPFSLAS